MGGVRWWGGMYLWFRHSFGAEMPLYVFQTIYQPRKLPRKKGGTEERVYDDPEPDLDAPSVYGIASPLPRCELPGEVVDVLKSIYQADQKTRSYGFILNRHRCLVELGLMASKAEMDQGRRPRPTLAKLTKQRPKTLVPGSAEDASQRKVVEGLSRAGNKEVPGASNVIEVDDAPEVEVPLTRKRKANAGAGPGRARRTSPVLIRRAAFPPPEDAGCQYVGRGGPGGSSEIDPDSGGCGRRTLRLKEAPEGADRGPWLKNP
ncbi:hypothetical protein Adt_40348 [Abeliophyllum distichum]|uniref:Uncharacterized protein n=1 Tax=Abeliophyllum distichum TaxID=126358 RepID=A0ABD1Q7R8_9LAMI